MYLIPIFFHDGSDSLVRVLVVGIDGLEVGINKGGEFAFFLDDVGFADIGKVIEMMLDFFRVDVLSTGTENDVFTASRDEKFAFLVNLSEVSLG